MLSGLFWCLCFSVVFVLLFRRVRVFCCLGGGHAPAQTENNKTDTHAAPPPARTAKKKKKRPPPPPSPPPHRFTPKLDFQQKCEGAPRKGSFFFLLFGRVAWFFLIFFVVEGGKGEWFHVLLFGRWACLISRGEGGWGVCVFNFLLFERWEVFIFCCLGGGRVLFFDVRAGGVIFCCCSGGDGNSLTYRPAWLGGA